MFLTNLEDKGATLDIGLKTYALREYLLDGLRMHRDVKALGR
ncbi:MAG: hypothetical protein ABI548_09995 [Polyangiaceae bacterium]